MPYSIGIDPGWASCGFAVMQDSKVIFKGSYVPRDHKGTILGFVEHLESELTKAGIDIYSDHNIQDVTIERYVAYKGIQSEASENILMLIGGLNFYFNQVAPVNMVRAIEWKPKICKYLVRTKGFNNPYTSFDKKFSILAAKTLSGLELDTDHEADAICLSYLGEVDAYNLQKEKEKRNGNKQG